MGRRHGRDGWAAILRCSSTERGHGHARARQPARYRGPDRKCESMRRPRGRRYAELSVGLKRFAMVVGSRWSRSG